MRPFVLDETGADESFLVGTRAQLETFARSILRALAALPPPVEHHGVRVSQPRFDAALTDPLADVVIDGVLVVGSEADRRALVSAIRSNCGDLAIGWPDEGPRGAGRPT